MKHLSHPSQRRGGFSLIELLVVISIIAVLSGVLVPRVSTHMRAARDAQRVADLEKIQVAIDRYFEEKGKYPEATKNSSYGGWDVSHDGRFIATLQNEGYLEGTPVDPVNDATYHYRYYVFEAGANECRGDSPYYVLGILNFEDGEFAARNKGFFRCSGRNFGREFAYVTGGGASFER